MNRTPEPGLYDDLLTQSLTNVLQVVEQDRLRIRDLEPGEGRLKLAAHLSEIAAALVRDVDDDDALSREAGRINALLSQLLPDGDGGTGASVVLPPQLLTGIERPGHGVAAPSLPSEPVIPLREAELLVNAPGQPSLGQLIRQECACATQVDLICAFIGPHGVHTLLDAIEDVNQREGVGSVRVITSTWLGATHRAALDMLVRAGARVFVAYDGNRLRLHAKSWRFVRPGRLSTAYVGSSNISRHALETAVEWNVRISERTNESVIERMRQTFEAYLADEHFEEYLPDRDADRLDAALARAGGAKGPRRLSVAGREPDEVLSLRPRPFAFQQRILDELDAERTRHGRHKNLVVAATGTGKTVIAAFDYARLADTAGSLPSLLFVAHRGEILEQSRNVFRSVLGRPQFGEILASDRPRPTGKHVFAMIQSLHGAALERFAASAYEIVIVDEFHHAEAPTYKRLLTKLAPRELVGLTATPERADGGDVTRWFDGRIASELRLWEAIDQGLLSPFHYFGVDDTTQLSKLTWSRGGYDLDQLSGVLTGNHARVATIVRAIDRYVPSPSSMRALGFCVTVEHAKFMAREFSNRGIASAVVEGNTPRDDRRRILASLRNPDDPLRCIFSVDVLGEGVDVPDVDTLLLLRPTQSATVFLQQLGRGLRLAEGKEALTVLDLIGIPHANFRFDRTLRTIIDPAGGTVRRQAEQGFPYLPSGCEIVFEDDAHDRVLASLRAAVGSSRWRAMAAELRELTPETTLREFLLATDREPEHLYSGKARSWTALRRDAGHLSASIPASTRPLHDGLYRLLHVDDEERVAFYVGLLALDSPPNWSHMPDRQQRMLDMLLVGLWGARANRPPRDEALDVLWNDAQLRDELRQLFRLLDERATNVTLALDEDGPNPLRLHARYSREEALVAFATATFESPRPLREGVIWMEHAATDSFFVTLRKDELVFSPRTRYHDYALTPNRFHWESQSTTSEQSPTARRYIGHREGGSHVALFVRETQKTASGAAAPFTFLGTLQYESHQGSAPVQFVWRLDHPMPADLYEVARLVAS